MDQIKACKHPLEDGLQAFVGNDVQQLERWTRWLGFTLLPLTHRRRGCMQVLCKDRVAELQAFSKAQDVRGIHLAHRRRTDRIELAHRHLVNHTAPHQGGQVATQRLNDLAHNAPRSEW